MYTKLLRNPDGTFRATKILIERELKAPAKLKVILFSAASAVGLWELGKAILNKKKE